MPPRSPRQLVGSTVARISLYPRPWMSGHLGERGPDGPSLDSRICAVVRRELQAMQYPVDSFLVAGSLEQCMDLAGGLRDP